MKKIMTKDEAVRAAETLELTYEEVSEYKHTKNEPSHWTIGGRANNVAYNIVKARILASEMADYDEDTPNEWHNLKDAVTRLIDNTCEGEINHATKTLDLRYVGSSLVDYNDALKAALDTAAAIMDLQAAFEYNERVAEVAVAAAEIIEKRLEAEAEKDNEVDEERVAELARLMEAREDALEAWRNAVDEYNLHAADIELEWVDPDDETADNWPCEDALVNVANAVRWLTDAREDLDHAQCYLDEAEADATEAEIEAATEKAKRG